MTARFCSAEETKWQEATRAAQTALAARLSLWDGIAGHILKVAVSVQV